MTLLPRRTLLLGIPALLAHPRLMAQTPNWLVSPDEVRAMADDVQASMLHTRSAGAPSIEVLSPNAAAATLASPVAIELAFRPAADAHIAPESFRIYYGVFKLDLTQRLLSTVKVQAHGLRVEQAAIPSGQHRLVLQISDTQGRTGTRELRFSVA